MNYRRKIRVSYIVFKICFNVRLAGYCGNSWGITHSVDSDCIFRKFAEWEPGFVGISAKLNSWNCGKSQKRTIFFLPFK
jgi:hypothetical protein